MNLAVNHRLEVERRLLAALFLWPCAVDLDPRHFLEPRHGALYEVLDEARVLFGKSNVELPDETTVYDETLLTIVVGLALEYARRSPFESNRAGASGWAQWVEEYVLGLLYERVTKYAIADLVEMVRECPRCGG